MAEDDNRDNKQEEDDEQLIAPRVKVAEDGSLMIDEASLTVEVKRAKGPNPVDGKAPIFEHGSTTTYSSFKKRNHAKIWSREETEMFFLAISMVGTDFSMMCQLFPHRAQSQMKNKFNREDRDNSWRVDKALKERRKLDIEFFSKLLENILKVQKCKKPMSSRRSRTKSPSEEKRIRKRRKQTKVKMAGMILSDVGEKEGENGGADTYELAEEKDNEGNSNNRGIASPRRKGRRKKKDQDESSEKPSRTKSPSEEKKMRKRRKQTEVKMAGTILSDVGENGGAGGADTHELAGEKDNEGNSNNRGIASPQRKGKRKKKDHNESPEKPSKKKMKTQDRAKSKAMSQPKKPELVTVSASQLETGDDNNDHCLSGTRNSNNRGIASPQRKGKRKKKDHDRSPEKPSKKKMKTQNRVKSKTISRRAKPEMVTLSASQLETGDDNNDHCLSGTRNSNNRGIASPQRKGKRKKDHDESPEKPSKKKLKTQNRVKSKTMSRHEKPEMVTLSASQLETGDDNNDHCLSETQEMEQQHHSSSPHKDSSAPVFVPVSMNSPQPVVSGDVETLEELDVSVNVPDMLGISQGALCPDASCKRAQASTSTAPCDHQLDLQVDVTSDHAGASSDEHYIEVAQTLLTIGAVAHRSQLAPPPTSPHSHTAGAPFCCGNEISNCVLEDISTETVTHIQNGASAAAGVPSGPVSTQPPQTTDKDLPHSSIMDVSAKIDDRRLMEGHSSQKTNADHVEATIEAPIVEMCQDMS